MIIFISVLYFFFTSEEWKQKKEETRHRLEIEGQRKEEIRAAEKEQKMQNILRKESMKKKKEAEKLKLRLAELEKFELKAPHAFPDDADDLA